jgi:4-amino-4-deoxy-L-arabinose transferase-like glycosyltransferase
MLDLRRRPAAVVAREHPTRREPRWLLPAAVAVAGALALYVALFRLTVPTWLGDEIAYAKAGRMYLDGVWDFGLEHPPLAKYILGESQQVLGTTLLAVRLPAALASLATGVLLGALAYRVGGWWAATLTFAIWTLMPRPELIGNIDIGQVQISRYGRLEAFMGAFAAAGLLSGWRWSESGRWGWAGAAGAFVGLAATCKPPGILMLPAVISAGLVALPLSRRTVLQAGAVACACALAAAAVYLPILGDTPHVIREMFRFSDYRNVIGHPFVIAGTLYTHPPWWTNLWWQSKAIGVPASVVVVACIALAPFVLRRALWVMLLLAILVPAGYLAFGLHYALPYYYYTWQPPLLALCALVIYALLRRTGPVRLLGAALAVPLAIAGVGTVIDVSSIKPRDYAAAAHDLRPQLRSGSVITWEGEVFKVLQAELPGVKGGVDPRGVTDLAAIIVDPTTSTRRPNEAISTYLREHRGDFVLRRVDFLRVYLPRSRAVARRLGEKTALKPTP